MNQIELITKYSPEAWDFVYKQESVISLLDADNKSMQVKWEGAKTVKIGKWQNGGLTNYYRNNTGDSRVATPGESAKFIGSSNMGYQRSAARFIWEEFTVSCDRAAAFEIEYFDDEESGGKLVANGVKEVSRTAIVPEVDAYSLSKLASYCTKALGNYVEEDISTKPLAALNRCFKWYQDNEVPANDQLVYCSTSFINALRETNEVTKFLGQTDFSKDISFEITKYQGRDLVTVSPQRLRTNVELITDGENGGFTFGADSKHINFLAVAKSAVVHVVKYNKVKIISGDANLAARGFDGYTIFARIYHDIFVPDNKRVALYCSVATSGDAPAMKLDVTVKNSKIKSIVTVPGDKLCFTVTQDSGKTEDPAVGAKFSAQNKFVLVKVGDTVGAEAVKFYAIDSDMKVLAKQEVTPSE